MMQPGFLKNGCEGPRGIRLALVLLSLGIGMAMIPTVVEGLDCYLCLTMKHGAHYCSNYTTYKPSGSGPETYFWVNTCPPRQVCYYGRTPIPYQWLSFNYPEGHADRHCWPRHIAECLWKVFERPCATNWEQYKGPLRDRLRACQRGKPIEDVPLAEVEVEETEESRRSFSCYCEGAFCNKMEGDNIDEVLASATEFSSATYGPEPEEEPLIIFPPGWHGR